MATAAPRQYGRRGTNSNPVSSDSGVAMSPSSTASTLTPPRRYVLDVPTGRTSRTSRLSANRLSETIEETNTRTGGIVTYTNEELSRSPSRDYYYRDSGNESNATITRYGEDSSIKQLIQSGVSFAGNPALEDQEVRAITARATPDVKDYPINIDENPELIVRPNTQRLTYKQDIAVRYLKPATPPPPGPIIIREIRAPAPPAAPPIILRQRPPPPRTPSPVIIREKPPVRPKSVPTTVIRKIIPPPPPPPRKLIIERLPKLPPKPRPVIIERWLPYEKQKRQVIHERARPFDPQAPIKNTIIEWRPPEVEIVKQVKKLGVQQADPQRYSSQFGDKLYTTEFVQRKLNELGLQEEIALMQEQQRVAEQEERRNEQTADYSVRSIMNAQTNSTRGSSISRLVRSSSTGLIDEYYDEQMVEPTSTFDSGDDDYQRGRSILTEDMLVQSTSNNNGKFPTRLLTKLGSQVYDMPSEQVDLSNLGRRTTTTSTTTTTRYLNVDENDPSYDAAIQEVIATSPRYAEERYVQMRSSDFNNVLANYDVYSETGEKLQGEQVNY